MPPYNGDDDDDDVVDDDDDDNDDDNADDDNDEDDGGGIKRAEVYIVLVCNPQYDLFFGWKWHKRESLSNVGVVNKVGAGSICQYVSVMLLYLSVIYLYLSVMYLYLSAM